MNSINTFPYESPVIPESIGFDVDELAGVITYLESNNRQVHFQKDNPS